MTKEDFKLLRKKLGKTQVQLAEILGMSLKTIHSYEQGWRVIPMHIERHLYFLLINQRGRNTVLTPCWEKKLCIVKEQCPAWEFQSGHLCWFLCGTLCSCAQDACHKEKLELCKECDIFTALLK
ncbi:MAG: helix-turn-helix transcriptional regulator [Pseudomonadota bacterium]